MSDALQAADLGLTPRKSRWPQYVCIALLLLTGVGWLLAGWVQNARLAAQRTTDK